MYRLALDESAQLHVHYKQHVVSYGLDGSLVNPLEATYAALAGCAGVYSRKACKALQISAAGIEINCKPVVRSGNMIVPQRFVTDITFPEHITAEQRQRILDEVSNCAVKQLIHEGANVEFVTRDATLV
jgi:uncharacterized OsmC-like protein